MSTTLSTDRVRDQFGPVAAAYVASSYHASGPDLAALVEAARLTGAEHVLDLGCGAGHAALAVAPHVAQVEAVDVTPDMVATAAGFASQRGVRNVAFRVADVAALPFEEGRFDVAISRVAAHHFSDPRLALGEIRRVLRPGARLVLIDSVAPEDAALDTFINCIDVLRDASHVRNWRVSEWLPMLADAGFVEAELVARFRIPLDGQDWVQRMRTPLPKVATIRALFREATAAQREAFDLRAEDPWGFSIPVSLLRASKP
jgi:SAM-dependent methyltransferase